MESDSNRDAVTYLLLLHNYCCATWEDLTGPVLAESFYVGKLTVAVNEEYIQVITTDELVLLSIHSSVGIYAVLETIRKVVYFVLK